MSSAVARKYAQQNKLRNQLKKRKESLADQFQFKVYVMFHFKEKPCSIYESTDVVTVMTNDFREDISKKTKGNTSLSQKSEELFDKDIAQIHLSKWRPIHKDGLLRSNVEVDFLLWPRKDIVKIECVLFSRWRDDSLGRYLPLECQFVLESIDWQNVLLRMDEDRVTSEEIVTNDRKDVFLFVTRHQGSDNRNMFTKLKGLCLYVPQDKLLTWQAFSSSDMLQNYM